MTNNPESCSIEQTITKIIQQKKPQDVKQLTILIQEKIQLPEKQILDTILKLQDQGKIKLITQPKQTPAQLITYLKTSQTVWYWITIILATLTLTVVFALPENLYPWSLLRNTLGTIFVLWLPGYTFIKALFPASAAFKKATENFETIERIALNLGMSLALVPLVGLVLNYTPWGIRLTPIVLSLFMLTIIFATIALIREHQTKQKTQT